MSILKNRSTALSRVHTGAFYAVSCCISDKQKYLLFNETKASTMWIRLVKAQRKENTIRGKIRPLLFFYWLQNHFVKWPSRCLPRVQCDLIVNSLGDFSYSLTIFLEYLNKILGKFWNSTTFSHLGHFDLDIGYFLPKLPGHTDQDINIYLLPTMCNTYWKRYGLAFTTSSSTKYMNSLFQLQKVVFKYGPNPESFLFTLVLFSIKWQIYYKRL